MGDGVWSKQKRVPWAVRRQQLRTGCNDLCVVSKGQGTGVGRMRWADYEGEGAWLLGIGGGVCGICVWGVEGRPLGGRLLGRLVNTHVNVCAKLGFWLLWMGWVYVGVVSRQVVGQAGEYPCGCLCKTCVFGAVDFPVDFVVNLFS